ncbi:MAG: competence/damage-inducible protein A [Brumimicrobium sp.]
MQAAIITIGDELLIGQTINTNAAWIGQELSNQGISIYRSVTIRDERKDILDVVDDYFNHADLIIVTGGLGPTKDDITKETLCEYFKTTLELDKQVLERIKVYFNARGKEMLPSNIQQAELPKDAIILDNHHGTASGMWFEKGGKVLVSIPGVPYEMKEIMTEEVLPRAKAKFGVTGMYHQTLMTQGLGESFLAEKIADWEDRIYADGLFLAYLPSPGVVKLRLTSKKGAVDAEKIEKYFVELRDRFPKYAYGMNAETVYEVVGNLLRERRKTLGTVESCTGGGIANAFIQKSGSSDFFQGGFVTYSNALKMKLAGVREETLDKYGAVSEETVIEMAKGGQKNLGVDYTIAVSGIAGPDGGSEEKPVGTVWIAVAHPSGVKAKKFLFGEHRGRNLEKTQLYSANMLRRIILDIL